MIIDLLSGVLMACDDDDTTAERKTGGSLPVFAVRAPTARSLLRPHVAGSRRAEEEATIAKVLAMVPEEMREQVRGMLNNPNVMFEGSTNAELSTLLSTIHEIRRADIAARFREISKRSSMAHGTTATVALVDEMPRPGARAMVLRRASALPQTVILLPKAAATAEDLTNAVAAVFALRRRHGDHLPADLAAVVRARQGTRARDRVAAMARRLTTLRNAPRQTIDGVGEAQAIVIKLGPVKARNGPGF